VPTSKVPDKIKIGPQYFVIEQRNRSQDATLNDGSYGYTIDDGNLIVIDAGIHRTKKQVTVLHEIMHCIRMVNDGLPKPKSEDSFDDWEHYFISMLEGNLLAVLRDNAELADWLLDRVE
jgi:hypothetical protein